MQKKYNDKKTHAVPPGEEEERESRARQITAEVCLFCWNAKKSFFFNSRLLSGQHRLLRPNVHFHRPVVFLMCGNVGHSGRTGVLDCRATKQGAADKRRLRSSRRNVIMCKWTFFNGGTVTIKTYGYWVILSLSSPLHDQHL